MEQVSEQGREQFVAFSESVPHVGMWIEVTVRERNGDLYNPCFPIMWTGAAGRYAWAVGSPDIFWREVSKPSDEAILEQRQREAEWARLYNRRYTGGVSVVVTCNSSKPFEGGLVDILEG